MIPKNSYNINMTAISMGVNPKLAAFNKIAVRKAPSVKVNVQYAEDMTWKLINAATLLLLLLLLFGEDDVDTTAAMMIVTFIIIICF